MIRFAPLAHLLESLSAMPKKEQRFLQKQRRFPRIIRDSFLVRLSLLYPLKEWLALHDPILLQRAKTLGIFDQSFIPSTSPSELLREGYQGKSLGKEWQRRAKEEILTLFN
jgi:tRNA nucleotidyltransferase (CCA-adding enzyme)